MSAAEAYILLGLRLGRHVDGLVDAYYGPEELSREVDAEPLTDPAALVEHGDALLGQLEDGWLRDQVLGLRTSAGVLAGEEIPYSDEVERCYGVRPDRVGTDVYEGVHERLEELLPGSGDLAARYEAWRQANAVPFDKVVPLVRDLLGELRARTVELVELPEGEELVVEEVRDEPWWAFNYYLGDLRSRVVLNVDVPTTGRDLVHLAAHEVYPGHHTEHSVKEQLLIRERGAIEEGIQLVPTPQAVLSEGIAEVGAEIVLNDEGYAAAYDVLARHGIEVDPELTEQIANAAEPLGTIGLDAALMIHQDGASPEEAQAYIERWRLVPPDQAKHSVRFATDPTWRAYVVTYTAGLELCRTYVGGDRARFHRLLTEPVRITELAG